MSISIDHIVFLELLKASLFHEIPNIVEEPNWDNVYDIAKAQCVIALIEPVVPNEYKEKWIEVTYQSIAYYIKLAYEQNELVKIFHSNNIPMVILKGNSVAMYYPEPQRRTMGDIDFIVSKEKFSEAVELMKNNGYVFISDHERHIIYEKNGIEFELHRMMSSQYYNNIESIVMHGINHSVEYRINDVSFYGLPIYENGIVILGHIMQHLKSSGIGFRQIIDWMMFVHNRLGDYEWKNYFKPLAKEAGLEKLAIDITRICQKWLGLPDNITWCNSADEELSDRIFERAFIDGNFGYERPIMDGIKASMKTKGVFSYLQYAGMKHWKMAQKHKVLRPFAWIYQIFRYVRRGIVGLIHRDNIFRKEKPEMELEDIWERLE